jgi:PAS domain S-box-containing protein
MVPRPALVRAAGDWLGTSLHRRLVASFLATATVVLALSSLAAFLQARATLRQSLFERLEAVALVKEGELNLWIGDQRGDLIFLAGLDEVVRATVRLAESPPGAEPGTRDRVSMLLDSARSLELDASEVFLMSTRGGRVLASSDRARIEEYRAQDLYFVNGLQGTWIQNVYASPATGRPTVTISTPVRSGEQVAGVLAAHLDLTRIDNILAERTGLGTSGEAYLVTALNDFVSSRRFGREEARRGVHTVGVQRALAGTSGTAVYSNYAGARVLGAWRWNEARQLALLVEIAAAEAFAPARDLVLTILFFGLGAVALMAAGIVLVARRIAQPILGVAAAAERVARGDFDATAPVVTRDEVGVLARTFNDMTARLRALYDDLSEQIGATGRAYRALEESQQLLQSFVDNTGNLILAFDRKGRLLLINRRVEELLHVRRNEVRGQRPRTALPGELAGLVEEILERALGTMGEVERDARIEAAGATFIFHLIAFPLAHPGRAPFGAGIVGVDLTERARQEEEHRRLEAGVQQAQKLESLGLLAGGIAHDFNNILTAIVGGATMALDEIPARSSARADLEQVVTAAERAAKLTRQMLAYAGRASFAVETFDLNVVIREMAELIGVSVSRTVRLEQDLARRLPAVRADRTQVSQVILNLVTNAAEATQSRGGTVWVRTAARSADEIAIGEYRFAPAEAASFAELTVRDDGSGIEPDTMEKMFDPFYSTKGSGRGLGLAAVLGIVRQSGGALKVVSRPGAGTTFTVLFPSVSDAPRTETGTPSGTQSYRGSGTVLLVDDEEAVRQMIRRALERAGYSVLEAADGREGVAVFERERSRLVAIVLDVTMPVMGGAEAFSLMRQMGPLVPVVVSSGFDQQDTAHAFTGDAVVFLQKPYRPEQLLKKLRAMTLPPSPASTIRE